MLDIQKKPITIVGISRVTANDVAAIEIGELWQSFMNTPIKEQLSQSDDQDIFAVYSDYESNENGKYKITIGYRVNETAELPSGLSAVNIPAGNYQKYQANSTKPEDIVNAWQEVWQAERVDLPRNFVADFEVYHGDTANIYIGVN